MSIAVLQAPPAALAVETARMALPDGFADRADHFRFEGFGGRNKGAWSLDGYDGDFTRGESRLGIFDPVFVSNKGKGSFTFLAAETGAPLAASCQAGKKSVTIGIVSFDSRKMHYDCEFRRSGVLTGDRLILGQPRPSAFKARLIANDVRVGEAIIAGTNLTMRSVHNYAGTPFASQAPVGYLVDSGDTTVAAVELTDWNPSVWLQRELAPATRESVLVVALAIAVLRDPANSALED